MTALIQHKIIFRNTSGVKQAEISDFVSLSYRKSIYDRDIAEIVLNGDHSILDSIGDKWQVEIHRRDLRNSSDWYVDFYGFYRGIARSSDSNGLHTAKLILVGQKELLFWRIIAYKSGIDGRSTFSAESAETIMKQIVRYNATSSGTTADGRERPAAFADHTITLETDGTNGNTVDWSCAWDNLLLSLIDLSRIAGGDWDLIKTGATTWQFRWYTGQRGSDLTASVRFSLEQGNMGNVVFENMMVNEKTVIIAGGQGEASARHVEVVTSSSYGTSNNIERFWNGSSQGDDALADAASVVAAKSSKTTTFSFDPLQIGGVSYGVDYCVGGILGDIVGASYRGYSADQKIIGVNISVNPNRNEAIKILLEEV